ncbi:Aryl-phospho-beta-D-glucosidase BglC, GH1 family [Amycolatopsis sacchari]|uniref:Aryl-phospho-beta-D-glucosidase BglC, GH1 family n=1 Tax=Amycolatopsis sacchari TaxID=115433 RepID=A0A1I4DK18_9PSEU|nr:cellulase family glycosylhydrolase [Amycolatopsis sacchari]SFK93249.1 Aryl-phospho-beta-D-glucosidase BglC, GH1 family [Amycolatopsis sacchari]
MTNDATPPLRVEGSRLVTASGTPVRLRGVGLGGWLNLENFITGFPSTEELHRQAMRAVLGQEVHDAFFDRFQEVFFTDDDAAFLAGLGLNCVRVPFHYRLFEDDDRPMELKEEGFRLLDRAVDVCARHGLYTVLDLHAAPGHHNQRWHSDNPTHRSTFWQHRHFQDRVVHLWQALAGRYRGNPWVAGYNPLNEPADPEGHVIEPFYARLHQAIRAVDPDHVIFLDGNRNATEFGMFRDPWPNTVYTVHDYALAGFADAGPYPGVSRGEYVDQRYLEKRFLQRSEYMRGTGTPIWVGEFGPVYSGHAERDESRYRVLADQLEIYDEHDAGWSLWTYKDIGLQGVVHVERTSPYLERIAPVLEKKARLGVDLWGGTDAGIRHIFDPLERTVAEEFPRFDPRPFGQREWVQVLVRHILLAEPMVDDFARCFLGVGPEEARALADCFAFGRCVERTRLTDVLRAHL